MADCLGSLIANTEIEDVSFAKAKRVFGDGDYRECLWCIALTPDTCTADGF